jgi:hypothetical protein
LTNANTTGFRLVSIELVVHQPPNQRGLADFPITDQQNLRLVQWFLGLTEPGEVEVQDCGRITNLSSDFRRQTQVGIVPKVKPSQLVELVQPRRQRRQLVAGEVKRLQLRELAQ